MLFTSQCVRVNGSVSSVKYLKAGIQQGTVLGPVLFLIFINDLPLSKIKLQSLLTTPPCLLSGKTWSTAVEV